VTHAPVLTGAPATITFSLVDHFGRAVTEGNYRGRYMLLYFGFTHCRAVCPRALSRLSDALAMLGARASRIQPLYVTVDPERDSPAVMRTFLEQRFPRFTGLTGTHQQADAAKRTFRVFAEKAADPQDPGGYAMPHTALTYLVGPDGQYVAHFPDTIGAKQLAERLDQLTA
jgi:protein SCO1/2